MIRNLLLSISLFSMTLLGQGIDLTTNYNQNFVYYNPAYLGHDNNFRINFQHNHLRLNNIQDTYHQYLMYEQRFDSLNSSIGVQINQSVFGLSTTRNYLLAYSYDHSFSSDFSLLLGISGGAQTRILKDAIFIPPIQEPNPFGTEETQPIFNAGIAAAWRMFNVGYSALHFNRPYFNETDNRSQIQHTLFLRYRHRINRKLTLQTALLGYTDGNFFNLLPSITFHYNHLFLFQMGSRNTSGFYTSIGFTLLKHFTVGYSFESLRQSLISSQRLQQHEVFISYQKLRRPKPRYMFTGTPAF